MELAGSCHCQAVRFVVASTTPVPFMRCYCGICRKTAGSGGYAINLGADATSLQVQSGQEALRTYHARLEDGSRSPAARVFCGLCGSALWLHDPRWPDLLHPQAGAIDTPLPKAPEVVQIMLESRPAWADDAGLPHHDWQTLPEESLADWHLRHGLGGSAP